MTHLHHFANGVCADPRAIGGPCGAPQDYRPPTGKGVEFSDVLVNAEDLRDLIVHFRGTCAMPDPYGDAVADRLEALLPEHLTPAV